MKNNRKKLKKEFYNTEKGKNILKRLNRLFIYGIIGISFSIFILLTEKSISYLVIAYILLFVSAIYLMASFILRKKELDNYIINKK